MIKIKRIAGITLMGLGIVALPVALLLNQSVGKLFSEKFTTQVLHEQVFSTPKLATRLKAVVNERMAEVTDLKTGMIIAIFSKASVRKWQELLDELLPARLRDPVIDNTFSKAYRWIDDEEPYPGIVISTQPVIQHLHQNTEFLFRWAHSVTRPPMLEAGELIALKQQNYGDSIPPLLLANVPDSLYDEFAQRGGELMALQLQQAQPPKELNVTQMIREKVPAEGIKEAKAGIKKIRFFSCWLWVIILVILAGGVGLYGPKIGDIWSLAINSFGSMAMIMFALGWLASNYLLDNLELTIHAQVTGIPRAIRDQLLELITYYLGHASTFLYRVGSILLGSVVLLSIGRLVSQRPHLFLHLKTKKS